MKQIAALNKEKRDYDMSCWLCLPPARPVDKTVIPFTTHEGSGLASTVQDVKKAWPRATVKDAFAIYGHEVRTGMAKVERWLKGLGW